MSPTMDVETQYCAPNYELLPVVSTPCAGVFAWAVTRIRDVRNAMNENRLAS